MKLPGVLVHVALESQLSVLIVHSSISAKYYRNGGTCADNRRGGAMLGIAIVEGLLKIFGKGVRATSTPTVPTPIWYTIIIQTVQLKL